MISYSSHKVILCRKIQIGDYKGKRISGLETQHNYASLAEDARYALQPGAQ